MTLDRLGMALKLLSVPALAVGCICFLTNTFPLAYIATSFGLVMVAADYGVRTWAEQARASSATESPRLTSWSRREGTLTEYLRWRARDFSLPMVALWLLLPPLLLLMAAISFVAGDVADALELVALAAAVLMWLFLPVLARRYRICLFI